MAPFDTQLLKVQLAGTKLPEGTDYQHGEAEGFDNIKAYVKSIQRKHFLSKGDQHNVKKHTGRKIDDSSPPYRGWSILVSTLDERNHKRQKIRYRECKKARLLCEGGPLTKYGKSLNSNELRGGEKIIPLNIETAKKMG